MPEPADVVRRATAADAAAAGRLLHAFNTEYDEVTPGPEALAARVAELLEDGDTEVLLASAGADDGGGAEASGEPVGLAVLRFRKSLWSTAEECYLAELYVTPSKRGRGRGESLLRATVQRARERGADYMDLATSEDDVAARELYEKLGFRRTEGDGGPVMFVYELEL